MYGTLLKIHYNNKLLSQQTVGLKMRGKNASTTTPFKTSQLELLSWRATSAQVLDYKQRAGVWEGFSLLLCEMTGCTGHKQPLVIGASEAASSDVLGTRNHNGLHNFSTVGIPARHLLAAVAGHPQPPIFVSTHAIRYREGIVTGVVYELSPVSDGARAFAVGVDIHAFGMGVHVVHLVVGGTPANSIGQDSIVELFQHIYKQ